MNKIEILSKSKGPIGFPKIRFESGVNYISYQMYKALTENTNLSFNYYIEEGLFVVKTPLAEINVLKEAYAASIQPVKASVILNDVTGVVEDKTSPEDVQEVVKPLDWSTITGERFTRRTLDKFAQKEYGIKLDGRKSFDNMVAQFKTLLNEKVEQNK